MPIIEASAPDHLSTVRELFVEYANSIAVDLCFQDFDRELVELPGRYAPPTGSLLLALDGTTAAGCVGLRKIGDGICEMKRLYVRYRELVELPGRYAPPTGSLLLALDGTTAAGSVGLRKIGDGICEMKRLYVRAAFRGKGLGRALASDIIAAAGRIGYERMRLDTLSSMKAAIALYQSQGFRRIPPYYDNPNHCAVFMELDLR